MNIDQFGGLKRIHFIGIGGIGMSGIAQVLFHNGYTVTGSDIAKNTITTNLSDIGIHVFCGHAAAHLDNVDVVVVSSAIAADNPELVEAHDKKIPILTRAEMLAELMRFKFGIAVSGTHGKTTTTSLIAHIFKVASLDPTYVIGGIVNSTAKNADLGRGKYLVTEADESDASFVSLSPMIVVVTNIDDDHMSTYGNNKQQQDDSFLEFIHRIPFYGNAILCGDDKRIQLILDKVARQFYTYGFADENDFKAIEVKHNALTTSFAVVRENKPPLNIRLNLPGKHNVLNALAAIAVATACNVPDVFICEALADFSGISRRFQVLGNYSVAGKQLTVVDDYGHHPAELEATIKTARAAFPDKKIMMIFQPHRYTRTQSLWSEFVRTLGMLDSLILLDIYPSGEAPIAGISAEDLGNAISKKFALNVRVSSEAELLDNLQKETTSDALVLCQGAGSVSKICRELFSSLDAISYV